MIIITEELQNNVISYNSEIIDEHNKSVSKTKIRIKAKKIEVDNKIYFVIYDNSHRIIQDLFEYLNYTLYNQAYNTKEESMTALKLLVSFEILIGKKSPDFTMHDIELFKSFLRGDSIEGINIKLKLITRRSSNTINLYFSCIRNYIKNIGVENSLFLEKRIRWNRGLETDFKRDRYIVSDKSYIEEEVPAYISLDEFVKILYYVREKKDILAEIIIRLQYELGMRIGEVLGLTADDVYIERIKDDSIPVIVIRNHYTDKSYQFAKTCMKVKSREQYYLKEYWLENYGFQKVYPSVSLYRLIDLYIENKHSYARERFSNRYYSRTITAHVDDKDYSDDNYYIFIGKDGTPISNTGWNKKLKNIYEDVGIVIDCNVKKYSLNHRLRHGFAMFQIEYMHLNNLNTLRMLMRHRNSETVKIYLQYTREDKIKIKEDFQKTMYKLIPALNECKYIGGDV